MKFVSLMALMASMTSSPLAVSAAGGEVCLDTWAHGEDKAVCLEPLGFEDWGWSNGRYGMSGCTACECPLCPTEPPTPDQPPTPATEAPTPDPIPLPIKCMGFGADVLGDPHIRTFDGLKYDCQGEGEFQILKSLSTGFQIQGRFQKFDEDRRPTTTKSVVWEVGNGDPTIQVTTPDTPKDGSCLPDVYVENVLRDIENEGVGDPNIQSKRHRRKKADGYIFYYHDSGLQISVRGRPSSKNGCVLAVKVCLPSEWEVTHGGIVGLFGNPDNEKNNDWMDTNGNTIALPLLEKDLKREPAYDYCVPNWCITEASASIFHYLQGESHAKFNNCNLAADDETPKCMDDPPTALADVCGLDNHDCLIDGCAGGVDESKSLLDDENDMKEEECGRLVFSENFDSPFAMNWGDIQKGSLDTKFLMMYKPPKVDEGEKQADTDVFSKLFQVPPNADMVQIEFLFYEIGHWEGANEGKDYVHFFVGETPIDLLGFDFDMNEENLLEYHEGHTKGLAWNRVALSGQTDMGFGFEGDQIHKVTVSVPPDYYKDGTLKLSFLLTMSHFKDNEAGGVDDFKLVAYGVSCAIDEEMVQPTDVEITTVDLPLQCDQRVATLWGDPHMNSFDGVTYDCQGEGEFTLAQSFKGNDKTGMEIQGRFEKFGSNMVTVMRALAVKEVNASKVMLELPEQPENGVCSLKSFVGGQEFNLLSNPYLSETLMIENLGDDAAIIYYPETKLQIVVVVMHSNKFGCYMSVKICIPLDYRDGDQIFGLLGSADGDPDNEWMDAQGKKIAASPKGGDSAGSRYFASSYEHCTKNWCIRDAEDSLFKYHGGKDHGHFMNCDADYYTSAHEDCAKNPKEEHIQTCGLNMACIIDYCSGDADDGKNAIKVSSGVTSERGCGYQILYENFDHMSSANYGLRTMNGAREYESGSGKTNIVRVFDKGDDRFAFLTPVPSAFKRILIEFHMHAERGFDPCMDPVNAEACLNNKLFVSIGNHHSDMVTIGLEMFGLGTVTEGFEQGIMWRREKLTPTVTKVTIEVPAHWFVNQQMLFQMKAFYLDQYHIAFTKDHKQTMVLGVDELRITGFSGKCHDMKKWLYNLYQNRAAKDNTRNLIEYMPHALTFFDPEPRDPELPLKWNQGSSRALGLAVETDDCTCICPPIGEGSDSGSTIIPLYIGAESNSCLPLGESFGTVTMTANHNHTVTVSYTVPAGFSISETNMYAGEEVLPGLSTGSILGADEFPHDGDHDPSVVTYTYYNVDPLRCDFYLAAHAKVCGPFPPSPEPTNAPTTSPTELPTVSPTTSPTTSPTHTSPTVSPTTSPTTSPTHTSPTTSPTQVPTQPTPGSSGDPHVMDWNGTLYDFHGACDLVLLNNPGFANGKGMQIHIRTEIDTWWSYIKTAVLKIGDETFEVMGGEGLKYWINGKPGKTNLKNGRTLSKQLAGEYPIRFRWMNDKQHTFKVDLGNGEHILFKTFKQFVRVQVEAWNVDDFVGSNGLMGSFPGGVHFARDNSTILDDPNMMGQEWQVLSSESKLFHNINGPQHPQKCTMPTETETGRKRRLGEGGISLEDAEAACARVDAVNRNACVFDVLATNDKEMAGSY